MLKCSSEQKVLRTKSLYRTENQAKIRVTLGPKVQTTTSGPCTMIWPSTHMGESKAKRFQDIAMPEEHRERVKHSHFIPSYLAVLKLKCLSKPASGSGPSSPVTRHASCPTVSEAFLWSWLNVTPLCSVPLRALQGKVPHEGALTSVSRVFLSPVM